MVRGEVADIGSGQRVSTSAWTTVATATAKMRADLPLAVLDAVLIGAAYLVVFVLRFDGSVPTAYWSGFRLLVPLALTVHLAANAAAGLYGQVWRHASIIEARRVVTAAAGAFVGIALSATLIGRHQVPLSVPLFGAALAPLLVGGLRFQSRLFALRRRTVTDDAAMRVVIVGAGSAGGKLIRDMQQHPEMGLLPVAAVDDDLDLIGRSIGSVPVFGPLEMLPNVVRRFAADTAVLAIDRADGELVRRVATLADQADVTLKVMPPTKELVSGNLSVRDVRDVQISDLLGRRQIATDLAQVRATIAGKRVLVTGAGGSIGSEILVQVAGLGPDSLVALDCDETHLFDAAALIGGACTQVLADVRDPDQVQRAFDLHRPEVVFHAAALKHVPILEAHPSQAVATNVIGTRNVVRAAKRAGVQRFVLISTDKAVNPSSVMGATKQLAEQILLAEAPEGLPWSAVRFGNVLGSRGSVVPTFMRQIAAGGPVTVTDVNMTRYFMTIPEAVELVLQSSALSEGNDLFMLDMGQPVKILDLAYRMIRLSGRRPHTDVPIQITGMRPGEKLTEELRTTEEATADTAHPAVIRVIATSLSAALLSDGIAALEDTLGDEARTRRTLVALVSGSVARDHAAVPVVLDHTSPLQPTE